MNLLFVGRLPPQRGGSTILCLDLLLALAARGHRVRVLSGVTPAAGGARRALAAALPRIVIEQYPLPYFSGDRMPALVDETYRAAEREGIAAALPGLVARERPDVVVVGQESSAWHVPALARAHDVPVVLWVHGGSTFMGLAGRHPGVATPRALLDGFRAASLLVTVAEHLTADLRRLGLERIRTIPNAVDLGRFAPRAPSASLRRKLDLDPGDVVVMHLSNLNPTKRAHDLVRAMTVARRADPRLRCVVVGDGPTREAVERDCAATETRPWFRFPGWIAREDVPEHLSLADVVVSTSVHEGQSLVCLEAQACGRLVVASDIPGSRELIVDGETGLLFGLGDTAGLADLLLRAAADPALGRRIGRQARRAREAHRHDAMVLAHERALADAAGRASAG